MASADPPKRERQLPRSELERLLETIQDEIDTLTSMNLDEENASYEPEQLIQWSRNLKDKMISYNRCCKLLKSTLLRQGCSADLQLAKDNKRGLQEDCAQSLAFINERLKQLNHDGVSSFHFDTSSVRSGYSLSSQLDESIPPTVSAARPDYPAVVEPTAYAPREPSHLPTPTSSSDTLLRTNPIHSTLAPLDRFHPHPSSAPPSSSKDSPTVHPAATPSTALKLPNYDPNLSLLPSYSSIIIPQHLNGSSPSLGSYTPPHPDLNPRNALLPIQATPHTNKNFQG
ncbi:uncharacterized protein PB18E9.04c-like [Hyalella azteca]|uniref:Uncharacterized protein PB18E9.04c-like n=1 Tax=Hyalella azteca TaxID=294128 RepID=A0A979FSR8_HYAAZ|nr:uncharacterized protein PB18E9.04c-like [Hyalella azteca]